MEVVEEGTLEEEEASGTRVSKEDVVVVQEEEEEEDGTEEVSFQVDQTRGMEEKVTREFLKTEVVEEEEDVAGLAVVVFHLEFAANVHQHKRVVLIFCFCIVLFFSFGLTT